MREQTPLKQIRQFKVLLIADRPDDARRLRGLLSETRGAMAVRAGLFEVTWLDRFSAALELLARDHFDAVLLDLRVPDGEGLHMLARARAAAAPEVPVVVLAGCDDDGQALAAIQHGAQDYVPKDGLDGRILRRMILHAIERKRSEAQLLHRAAEVESARARIEQQAAELKARAEQLDRINRELDDFAYITSHDLKEPLRGIRAYCELLLEDCADRLDAQGRRRLNALLQLCHRLEHLIEDLLTYCRVGGTRPADTDVDLNHVAAKVLETMRSTIDRRGASIRVVDRLPKVNGEPTLIGMALGNLISNAVKFNEQPRGHVQIGCLATDPPTIYVQDDGIGIDQAHHEAIFTIFRRLHSRKKYEGSGAGLTIVRKIVEAHGGRIWVQSQPGAGSTFFFTLGPPTGPGTGKAAAGPPHWVEHSHGRQRKRKALSR